MFLKYHKQFVGKLFCTTLMSWVVLSLLLSSGTSHGASISSSELTEPMEVYKTDQEAQDRVINLAAMEKYQVEKEENNAKGPNDQVMLVSSEDRPNETTPSGLFYHQEETSPLPVTELNRENRYGLPTDFEQTTKSNMYSVVDNKQTLDKIDNENLPSENKESLGFTDAKNSYYHEQGMERAEENPLTPSVTPQTSTDLGSFNSEVTENYEPGIIVPKMNSYSENVAIEGGNHHNLYDSNIGEAAQVEPKINFNIVQPANIEVNTMQSEILSKLINENQNKGVMLEEEGTESSTEPKEFNFVSSTHDPLAENNVEAKSERNLSYFPGTLNENDKNTNSDEATTPYDSYTESPKNEYTTDMLNENDKNTNSNEATPYDSYTGSPRNEYTTDTLNENDKNTNSNEATPPPYDSYTESPKNEYTTDTLNENDKNTNSNEATPPPYDSYTESPKNEYTTDTLNENDKNTNPNEATTPYDSYTGSPKNEYTTDVPNIDHNREQYPKIVQSSGEERNQQNKESSNLNGIVFITGLHANSKQNLSDYPRDLWYRKDQKDSLKISKSETNELGNNVAEDEKIQPAFDDPDQKEGISMTETKPCSSSIDEATESNVPLNADSTNQQMNEIENEIDQDSDYQNQKSGSHKAGLRFVRESIITNMKDNFLNNEESLENGIKTNPKDSTYYYLTNNTEGNSQNLPLNETKNIDGKCTIIDGAQLFLKEVNDNEQGSIEQKLMGENINSFENSESKIAKPIVEIMLENSKIQYKPIIESEECSIAPETKTSETSVTQKIKATAQEKMNERELEAELFSHENTSTVGRIYSESDNEKSDNNEQVPFNQRDSKPMDAIAENEDNNKMAIIVKLEANPNLNSENKSEDDGYESSPPTVTEEISFNKHQISKDTIPEKLINEITSSRESSNNLVESTTDVTPVTTENSKLVNEDITKPSVSNDKIGNTTDMYPTIKGVDNTQEESAEDIDNKENDTKDKNDSDEK